MKLMIEIPEEDYIRLRDEGMFGNVTTFKRAVREGIPLDQEPCDDCISRQAAIDVIFFEPLYKLGMEKRYAEEAVPAIFEKIKALPPVTPQYTDTEIQKMQDLEFAEIQKAYEIGKAENPNKWIPVSERLPEKPDMYTVTDSKGDVVRFVFNDTESSRKYWLRCAKAWMPLPEPYKASPTGAESEDKE